MTVTAFAAAYVSAVIGHLTTGGLVNASIGARIGLVTVAVVVSFVPLVALRVTVLREPSRPRPWLVLSAFLVSAVIRGVVLAALLAVTGIAEPLWSYRIAAAMQTHPLVLLGVAVAISSIRAHARTLDDLAATQRDLTRTESEIVDDLAVRNDDALAQIKQRLRTEIGALESAAGSASVGELRRLASEVVRPLSHQLAAAFPPPAPRGGPALETRITVRRAVEHLVERPPLQPGAAAAFMALLLTTAAIGVFGLDPGMPIAAVLAGSVWAVSALANVLLRRILPRIAPRARPVAVVAASLIVGFASSTASGALVPTESNRLVWDLGGGFYVAGVVLLFAGVTAVRRRQHEVETQLRQTNAALRRQLVRLRQVQWVHRQRLAQALHGPLQSAVTSAALRLDSAVRRGEADTRLIARIRETLLEHVTGMRADGGEAVSLPVVLARLEATWRGVCTVHGALGVDALRWLSDDPVATAVVGDLVTEAVANAVRHGGARTATISLRSPASRMLELTVHDDGTVAPSAHRRGLGDALLDACTIEWRRTSSSEGCTLVAVIPTTATAQQ